MLSKGMMGGGAILDGVLIVATVMFGWPTYLYYIWALLAVIWGIMILMQK